MQGAHWLIDESLFKAGISYNVRNVESAGI